MKNQSDMLDASAVILAGGKSSRMGRPKALLPFAGEPLIVHTVRKLAQCFPDVVVVAAPGQELPSLPVTLVRDTVAYQGPVGGIYYGLQAARRSVCFVTSCDVPFLNLALVNYLLTQRAHSDVVVPVWEDRLQPLHAVYRRRVVPLLQTQLERGQLRPILLYKNVPTREVGPDEIRRFDPEGYSFLNMNSPEDYQAALALWRTLSPASALSASSEAVIACTIELFGVARLRAKTAQVSVTLPPGASLRTALSALAEAVPELLGSVLTEDGDHLMHGFACNVNGQAFVKDMRTSLKDGDSVLILSSDAGG